MRILIVHNLYRLRGGEDGVVEAEAALLREKGHTVQCYLRRNDEFGRPGPREALGTFWSATVYRELGRQIREFAPDVVHVHNTFPLVSPAVFYAAQRGGVAVVQTLHNFRLMCVQAMLLRDGRVCEDCVGRAPWRGAWYGCYRGSRIQSTIAAANLGLHRMLGTPRRVTLYIALNEFCRGVYVRGGLPAAKIRIKPNFVFAPTHRDGPRAGGLYVGRLAAEKGVCLLGEAARAGAGSIDVIGEGPLEAVLAGVEGIRRHGWRSAEEVAARMDRAAWLALPSLWYEAFPRVLVEAYAHGLPVIAGRLGALAELIDDGVTGLLFEPGSGPDFARCIAWAEAHPERMLAMGRTARRRYEKSYTPETNYRQLMSIYREAMALAQNDG